MRYKVGIAANTYALRGGSDAEDQQRHLDVCVEAHHGGFDSIFVYEHHFTSYMVSPSPLTTLSYLAGRAPSAWLGTSVLILPVYEIPRLAETIAVIDNLAKGKCLFGVGRGRGDEELTALGVSRPTMDEFVSSIRELRTLLAGHPGEIRPRPAFAPEKRLCVASGAELPETLRGLGLTAMRNWSPDLPKGLGGILFVTCSVARSMATAESAARTALAEDLRMMDAHYGAPPNRRFDDRLSDALAGSLIGTPKQVLDRLREIANRAQAEHIVLEIAIGGRDPLDVREMALTLSEAANQSGGWSGEDAPS